ncbi:hypothetical protein GWI72_10525 [Microvirga tunisiensis]|uniref:Invasion associated locus B family protein n=1 Tax=Pannonibacter tanglangensis TaxID=2750084 RepID=A0A7X5F2S1_9HYPH|nr:hypothetical protein [Pannonibacter sp. XCT-53]NBN78701.1 hypothetical protein [Pannonibacter sp. XCT-53]
MTGIRFGFMVATLAAIAATQANAAEACTETSEGRRFQCGEWHVGRDIDEMTDAINWTLMTYVPNAGATDTWPSLSFFCRNEELMLLVAPGTYVFAPYELTLRIDAAKALTLPYQGAPGTAAVIRGKAVKALTKQMTAGQLARARLNTIAGQQTFTFELNGLADALALTPCKP